MTGIGSTELLLIVLIAMIVMGPGNIKTILKASREMLWKIKKHVHQFKDDYEVLDEIEHIKTEVKSVISSAEEEMDIRDLQKELSELKERTEKCIEKMEEIKKETEV